MIWNDCGVLVLNTLLCWGLISEHNRKHLVKVEQLLSTAQQMSNNQRHFYWLTMVVNVWRYMNGCVLVALKWSPYRKAVCNFWVLIARINPPGLFTALKDVLEMWCWFHRASGAKHRREVSQTGAALSFKRNPQTYHFLIWPMRGYYHWCLLDSHFNCWLQLVYSLHRSNTQAHSSAGSSARLHGCWLNATNQKQKGECMRFFFYWLKPIQQHLMTNIVRALWLCQNYSRFFASWASDATNHSF